MCRRITGAVRDLPIYLIRSAKILGRNALTACHTHGGIAPGGEVSALLVGTYGWINHYKELLYQRTAPGGLWPPDAHVWSCDIQPRTHGWAVLCDMSSPGKLYERCTPASATDQLWIDCSLSVL